MEGRDLANAVSAGPRGPVARERAVPAEPSVVVAAGVPAFDEWGHALGARREEPRGVAPTVPAGHELRAVRGSLQTLWLCAASVLFLVSAGLLARGVVFAEPPRVASVVAASAPARPARATPPSAALSEPVASAAPIVPVAVLSVADLPAEIDDVPSRIIASATANASSPHAERATTTTRRPRAPVAAGAAAKARRSEIVRDAPY